MGHHCHASHCQSVQHCSIQLYRSILSKRGRIQGVLMDCGYLQTNHNKSKYIFSMNQSEIGLVFGIFELIMFVTAPILGKYVYFLTHINFDYEYDTF
jgi:hypothetical protein